MVNKVFTGIAILMGTCIGVGILAIPHLAAQSGFLLSLISIFLIAILVIILNLCTGEIVLRTKEKHQLSGYAEKYLGKVGKYFMEFAVILGTFAAIIAYLFGIGESINFLIFENTDKFIFFGLLFGVFMSVLIWKGIHSFKKIEVTSISLIFILIFSMIVFFFNKIKFNNLSYFNSNNFFVPFGVIFFSLICFSAIPEINFVLGENKKSMKKIIIYGMLLVALVYSLFTFVVIGFDGVNTPEIATFSLGIVFIIFGILTMFGAYLASGNVLEQMFISDNKSSKRKSWFLSSLIPVILFFVVSYFNILSFSKILSVGGIISGGLIGILILLMLKKAKKEGNRKPEYSIPINWFLIILLILIFFAGVIVELF